MYKFTHSIFILFILFAVNFAAADENMLEFAMDHAQFRLQDDYVYLEVYYSITRNSLTFNESDSLLKAEVMIKTYLSKDGIPMLVDSLVIQDAVASLKEISSTQKFTELSRLQVGAGSYLLRSELTDMNSKATVTQSDSLNVESFSASDLSMSDIQFAISLSAQPERIWKFDKNGLRVMPNASRTYGTGIEKLYFYSEVYNLTMENNAEFSAYHVVYSILNDQGDVVLELQGKPRQKPGSSSIINGGIDIDQLSSGIYTFRIQVVDDDTRKTTSTEKKFNVYRMEDYAVAGTDEAEQLIASTTDEFAAMNEDQLDEYGKKLRYIMMKDEENIFKKLDVNGKRNFLNDFWKQRDPVPATAINEKKEHYFNLLEFANLNFTVGHKEGWKTDRARVLLIYGQPDDVEYHPSSTEQKAHQIWRYDYLEGGAIFVFVDLRKFGDYQLVHSTYRDEVQEYKWEDMYLPISDSQF